MAKPIVKVLIAAAICLAFWTIVLDLFEIASGWNLYWLRIALVLLTVLYTFSQFASVWSNKRRLRDVRSGNPAP